MKNRFELNLSGLSLVEIIVAVVILSLVLSGFVNLFISGKGFIIHSRLRMTAGELGRYFLDPLQLHVRQDTWDQSPVDPLPNNLLTIGNYKSTNNPFPAYSAYTVVSWLEEPSLDAITYYPVYEISGVAGTNLRKAKVKICWNESLP